MAETIDMRVDPTKDSDNDGDPDIDDYDPLNPRIHHPIVNPSSPHYDPYPELPNCCGYSLGKMGPDANKDFRGDVLCHVNQTCDDLIDDDCDGIGTPCIRDNDCEGYPATEKQDNGCTAPTNLRPGSDCDDCDPTINPSMPELYADKKDNNCNALADGQPCT